MGFDFEIKSTSRYPLTSLSQLHLQLHHSLFRFRFPHVVQRFNSAIFVTSQNMPAFSLTWHQMAEPISSAVAPKYFRARVGDERRTTADCRRSATRQHPQRDRRGERQRRRSVKAVWWAYASLNDGLSEVVSAVLREHMALLRAHHGKTNPRELRKVDTKRWSAR